MDFENRYSSSGKNPPWMVNLGTRPHDANGNIPPASH